MNKKRRIWFGALLVIFVVLAVILLGRNISTIEDTGNVTPQEKSELPTLPPPEPVTLEECQLKAEQDYTTHITERGQRTTNEYNEVIYILPPTEWEKINKTRADKYENCYTRFTKQ